jgi:hypothetical protein
MKHVVVFLGPSLHLSGARKILEADYRPPVAMGDVYVAAKSKPDMIVIADGVFGNRPSVMHQEILWCIREGVPVVGCSSMGALRAAELFNFGMMGWGKVFELFQKQILTDDDEVALAHAPPELGSEPTTLAMVDIRNALLTAAAAGRISALERQALVSFAKGLHFGERSLTTLAHIAKSNDMSAAILDLLGDDGFFEQHALKRQDIVSLLEHIASGGTSVAAQTPVRHSTAIWYRTMFDLDDGRGRNLMDA